MHTFAERVLFGTTLEEKLAPPPDDLADDAPGPAIATPAAPGRPDVLRLRRDGARAELPRLHELEDDDQRGRLLHFFANHELLATELMALVLLRFPDAPSAFRAGVLRTLREEQMHTKLYLRRMRGCGVRFGDLPVNGFFWRCVADMPTPIDYVTRLSLTFEQANLDYARFFAGVFQRSGDDATARLLDRIYRDEIEHVGYGLRWFRAWKNPADSDWNAFRRRLSLPLSAARAKGLGEFNEEGRRAAGLDEEFIRELRVYAKSRGRTPNVFWFNPEAERHAAGASSTPATAVGEALRHDLGILPAFAARRDDLVMLPRRPSTPHLERLHAAGFELPELVEVPDCPGSTRPDPGSIRGRRLNSLRPWAWSPETRETVAELGSRCARRPPVMDPGAFSKAGHAALLAEVTNALPPSWRRDWIVPAEAGGRAVTDPDDLPAVRPLVVKAAFSTAGRDRVIIGTAAPAPGQQRWIERRLAAGDPLWAEPWLERVLDFSFHLDLEEDGSLRPRGFLRLENSPEGRFLRAIRTPRFTDGLAPELRRFLAHRDAGGGERSGSWLRSLYETRVGPAVAAFLGARGHVGPAGIDGLVCRWPDGSLRVKPIVEINPRFTMGRIALELARSVEQHAAFALAIHAAAKGPLEPSDSFCRLAARWASEVPVRHGRSGRITTGRFPLNDPAHAQRFLAVFECPPQGGGPGASATASQASGAAAPHS